MRLWKSVILCWAGCASLGFGQQGVVLGPEATKAALAEMRQLSRANFEKIHTWRGSWARQDDVSWYRPADDNVLDSYGIPKEVGVVREHKSITVEFAIDRTTGQVFARAGRGRVQMIDARTGQTLQTARGHRVLERSLLRTPEAYLRVEEVGQDKEKRPVHQGQRLSEPEQGDQLLGANLYWLYGSGRNRSLWEELDAVFADNRNRTPEQLKAVAATQPNQRGYWLEAIRAGSPRLYHLVWRGASESLADGFVQEYWFDEAVGFNYIRSQTTLAGVRRNQYEVTYKQDRGVYVPQRILREHFDKLGRVHAREQMTLTGSTLNEPLPAEQFSLKNVGLGEGELVIDKRDGKEYRYRSGALVPASQRAE